MRQAGRYLESYRKVRAKNDVLTICKTPELSAKVTVDATTELGVDAAIIFADIMLPLEGIGQSYKLVDGIGPVVEKPIERMEDVKTIGKFSPKDYVPFVTDAVQLFDSWSGCLSPTDYQEFVLPFNKQIFERLKPEGIPRIHFGVGTAGILKAMREAGGDVFGVDWRISIDEAWANFGHVAIQGNLDPAILLGANELVHARSNDILARIGGRLGYLFNLAHGVLPDTPPEQVKNLVQFIHGTTRTKR